MSLDRAMRRFCSRGRWVVSAAGALVLLFAVAGEGPCQTTGTTSGSKSTTTGTPSGGTTTGGTGTTTGGTTTGTTTGTGSTGTGSTSSGTTTTQTLTLADVLTQVFDQVKTLLAEVLGDSFSADEVNLIAAVIFADILEEMFGIGRHHHGWGGGGW